MAKGLVVKFHRETAKQQRKREKRYRRFILKRTFIILIAIVIISFIAYFILNLNFFNAKHKSTLNQIENVQPAEIVHKDSVVEVCNIVTESQELNDSANSLVVGDERFLGKKYVLYDSISGYFGISISEWQHTVNWDTLYEKNETQRLKFVIIKATQGENSVDKKFNYNWKNSRNTNVNIGACHFYVLGGDPLKQAENYIKNVKLKKGDLFPILKIQVNYSGLRNLEIDKLKLVEELTIFLNRLKEQYGVKPILFTSYQFYNDYLKEELSDFNYMFAKYNNTPSPWMLNKDTAGIQLAPFVFIWEYSFDGKLNGITTTVRMNFIPKEKLGLIVLK